MEVFFVRHGQTDGNVAKRHQIEITKLTPKGKQQARDVSEKIADINPTHLMTSTHVRALETANIISDKLGLTPQTSQLFTELHRPKDLYGHRHFSFKSYNFIINWYLGRIGGDVNSDEGESYASLRQRIIAAKEYLEKLPDDARVVIVSHALFMSLFLAHVCQEKPLTLIQAFRYWMRLHTLKNTAIKHMSVTKIENGCGWKLVK